MKKTESICQKILLLPISRAKAFTNLVMSMSSNTTSKSVVGLSSNPIYHYHYSNMSKISENLSKTEEEYEKTFSVVCKMMMKECGVKAIEFGEVKKCYLLAQDMCLVSKPHSECLDGRLYGHQKGQVSVGMKLGFTHLRMAKDWSLPLKIGLVSPEKDPIKLAVEQIDNILTDKNMPLDDPEAFFINNADSGYGNAKYLSPLFKHKKLVNIVRLRARMKVYEVYQGEQKAKKKPKIYGKTYYLTSKTETKTFKVKNRKTKETTIKEKTQVSLMEYPSEYFEDKIIFGNGKNGIRKIWYFKNFLFRTKNGNHMQDKPFNIIKVEIWNEENTEKIFKRDMFLAITGIEKDQIAPIDAHNFYRTRFEAEGSYRFNKQDLFLDKFQTSNKQHFLNHLIVMMSAWWLLYAAKDEVTFSCPTWQKYLPTNKNAKNAQEQQQKVHLTPTQVKKSLKDLFYTFDKKPFLPTKYKKGKGRKKGAIFKKREKKIPYKKPNNIVKK